eukprot:12924586-Prorocentrum_lima.AAC.1
MQHRLGPCQVLYVPGHGKAHYPPNFPRHFLEPWMQVAQQGVGMVWHVEVLEWQRGILQPNETQRLLTVWAA